MSEFTSSVLIVEDDACLREALIDTLHAAGLPALAAADAAEALQLLQHADIALVISDVQMPGASGQELLTCIRKQRPDVNVVLMTAFGTVSQAVAAMREGATDYIVKPFDAHSLLELARRRLAAGAAARAAPGDMVAEDPESRRLLALARRMAQSDATVLITGPSGTGKEVYARFIRENSARAAAAYVTVNCAAIPENMLEATLFGHEKGAFTGALGAHAGKFEQAQGGTLLLDEISEMDLSLQAKILRVLQEREVERLGGKKVIPLNVRVIATSNRDLPAEARAGRFRADLFYRLNVMSLRLPPLRERPGDILPLARKALQSCARPDQSNSSFTAVAERKLLTHAWPGNARELNNIVQRAAWLAVGGSIDADDLDTGAGAVQAGADAAGAMATATAVLDGASEAALPPTTGSAGAAPPGALSVGVVPAGAVPACAGLDGDLRQRERDLILATLRSTGGSRKLTAERLGISPRTLRHKLQRLKAAGVAVPRIHELQLAG